MQFSERWLRSLVNPPLDTEGLSHLLTMAGLEVEEVEPVAPEFSGTRIHATDAKFVGVRMRLRLDDSRDHNARKGGSDRFDLLDLQARHSQQMTQSLCIEGRIHKAPQPAL